MNSIAAMYTEQGKYDEAISWFDKAIASNPKFSSRNVGQQSWQEYGNPAPVKDVGFGVDNKKDTQAMLG